MKISGYWWTALVVGLYAMTEALIPGVEGMFGALIAPVIVALLTALLTGLDKLRTSPPDFVTRGVEEERGFWVRFWLGD